LRVAELGVQLEGPGLKLRVQLPTSHAVLVIQLDDLVPGVLRFGGLACAELRVELGHQPLALRLVGTVQISDLSHDGVGDHLTLALVVLPQVPLVHREPPRLHSVHLEVDLLRCDTRAERRCDRAGIGRRSFCDGSGGSGGLRGSSGSGLPQLSPDFRDVLSGLPVQLRRIRTFCDPLLRSPRPMLYAASA
jgi:hypothetical protein